MARYYSNKPIDWGYEKIIHDTFVWVAVGLILGMFSMIFFPAFMINEVGVEVTALSILVMIVGGFSFFIPIMLIPSAVNLCAKLKHKYNYRKEVKTWEEENAAQRLLDSRDDTLAFLKEMRK